MPPDGFKSLLEAEARAAGLTLPDGALERLMVHCRLLAKWGKAVRLIGSLEPEALVRRHVLESLALLPYIQEPRGSLLDIGSGNGFPAIPLKAVLTDLRLLMLEPTLRKSQFLSAVVREISLRDCEVLRARVDRPRDLTRLGRWDTITMRAVAAIPAVLEGGCGALRPSGRILLMVGEAGRAEVLRRMPSTLELAACHQLPESKGSYIVAVRLAGVPQSSTVH